MRDEVPRAATGRLAGRVAAITGIARGQGRAHALRLAAEGADIVGVDLCGPIDTADYPMSTPADLAETVGAVEALGRRIVARQGDVRDLDALRAMTAEGVAAFGRLDFVVANAGIMPIWGASADTPQAWQDSLDVLLTGVMHTIEATYPILVEQGDGGAIVAIGSMAGLQPMVRTESGRTLGMLGYSAAKSALANLVQNYASMLARHRIRVNVVHPTGVATPMIRNDMVAARFAAAEPDDLGLLVNAMPVAAVDAADIAATVAWLCSPDARFVTGSAIRVDAGASLR